MSRRVIFSGKVKALIAGAVEKSSPNRAIESLGIDPNPRDLAMGRLKLK